MFLIAIRRGVYVLWGMRLTVLWLLLSWTFVYFFLGWSFIRVFRPLAVYEAVLWAPALIAVTAAAISTGLEGSQVQRSIMLTIDIVALLMGMLAIGTTTTTFLLDVLAPWGCLLPDVITLNERQLILCEDRWVTLWMWWLNLAAIFNSMLTVAMSVSSIIALTGARLFTVSKGNKIVTV